MVMPLSSALRSLKSFPEDGSIVDLRNVRTYLPTEIAECFRSIYIYMCVFVCVCVCVCVCVYRFQNIFLRCPTPRLHCFLSSHRPSFRFLSFMAFLIPSIQIFFGLPRALFCFGIHFSAILGNLPSAIL